MEIALLALQEVMSTEVLLSILIGVVAGTFIGALPGLGTTLGVTLVLPFSFGMEPMPAIMLMLAVYCSSTYGGAISAILINTPGTAASAATSLDGFPMVKKGLASEAIGWVTVASVVGGLLSAIILMTVAPQIAKIALKFGPLQTAALIMLAMTLMISVSRGSQVKGLIAGLVGIFIATVGFDPVTGDTRLTFGNFQLSAGVSLLPFVIGLFALAEVFDRAANREEAVDIGNLRVGMHIPPFSRWRKRIVILLRSSVIGTFVGSLPGTGSAIASFVSYAEAKRTSPRRDNFGKGEPDGMIASEAANNAVTGGALIPTLTLGIPGDVVMAVMMSSFLIHGITPGVALFRDDAATVYAIFESLIIINLLLLVAGWVGAQLFSRVLRIPEALLMAMVAVLSFVGALAARGNPFDLLVMFFAGVLGFTMRRTGFPVAPLIIGFVLGGKFELELRTALILRDYSILNMLSDPITLVLTILTVVALLWPSLRAFLAWRAAR